MYLDFHDIFTASKISCGKGALTKRFRRLFAIDGWLHSRKIEKVLDILSQL